MAELVAGRAARTVPLYQSRVPLSTPEGQVDWGDVSMEWVTVAQLAAAGFSTFSSGQWSG